jgi:2-haloacid dehalogenase
VARIITASAIGVAANFTVQPRGTPLGFRTGHSDSARISLILRTMIELRDATTLTFDCYGTLIDWEAGIERALARHAAKHRVPPPDLDAFLTAFGRLETTIQAAHPEWRYPKVLAELFQRLAADFAFPAALEDCVAFGESIGDWPPFPDSSAALKRLQRGRRLIVVSNVDRDSFAKSERALGVKFDAIVTAQDVGAYKPDPKMFAAARAAIERLGEDPARAVHVAQSLFHDIAPANAFGIPSVWVDRRAGRPGGATPDRAARPDLRVTSLAELADYLKA